MAKRDPESIYLQPECCADPAVGRTWCHHDAPHECDEGVLWTEYVRADLVGWRPIETAPKDGTDIFVTDGAWQQVSARYLPDPEWVFTTAMHDPPLSFTPTHWMPLPEPPRTPHDP